MDVAIIGIGLHRFGRSPDMSGMQQGASAVRAALADAGLSWADMQFAYGGSQDAGNADALVNELGLTGLQFTNIWNGCATGGSSLHAAYSAIKSGEYDLGVVVGFDKHPRGAFNPQPKEWGLDDWYGETGLMLTTRHYGSFEVFAPSQAMKVADAPTVTASKAAFELAGIGPEDVDVMQLQDTDSGTEIMHMAENGFCKHGEQEKLLREGATGINGSMPINTDGGCLANGEPVGASGLRQVYEVCVQLRGEGGARQVPNNPRVGYTHFYGAPGISGVNIITR